MATDPATAICSKRYSSKELRRICETATKSVELAKGLLSDSPRFCRDASSQVKMGDFHSRNETLNVYHDFRRWQAPVRPTFNRSKASWSR